MSKGRYRYRVVYRLLSPSRSNRSSRSGRLLYKRVAFVLESMIAEVAYCCRGLYDNASGWIPLHYNMNLDRLGHVPSACVCGPPLGPVLSFDLFFQPFLLLCFSFPLASFLVPRCYLLSVDPSLPPPSPPASSLLILLHRKKDGNSLSVRDFTTDQFAQRFRTARRVEMLRCVRNCSFRKASSRFYRSRDNEQNRRVALSRQA